MDTCDYLVFDISSVLYRTFYAQHTEDDLTIAGLATHTALTTLNKYYKEYKPKYGVIMAFDRLSWRKGYMSSDLAVSDKAYKGTRRKDMSPAKQIKYAQFLTHLGDFERLITQHTTIRTVACDGLEADDLIAGFVRLHKNHKVIVISSDSDLLQLKRHGNCEIITPATGKAQSLADFNEDPDYYTFHKCIRGDTADNIQSALPNVRSTAIREAYDDAFKRTALMKTKWTDQNGKEFLVEDLFEENDLLIHLDHQPEPIINKIDATVIAAMGEKKNFNLFYLMKFIGKYQLNKIKDNIEQYIPLLSKKQVTPS